MMKSTNYITRNQLKGYGVSSYHAIIITKNLQPISKSDRANIYSLQEVIAHLKEYLENPRIKQKTRQSLTSVLPQLIHQLNNVVPAIFENSVNRELGQSTKNLFLKMISLDKKIINSQAQIAKIRGKQVK